jgi:hypothetical protein
MLVLPVLKESINPELDGKKYPRATPRAMAINIQRVRFRSKKLSFFLEDTI